jgi:hypothetical protein
LWLPLGQISPGSAIGALWCGRALLAKGYWVLAFIFGDGEDLLIAGDVAQGMCAQAFEGETRCRLDKSLGGDDVAIDPLGDFEKPGGVIDHRLRLPILP